tara:strand:+ start:302 stop:1315 length:1014 start_codon:yes stop_codon:yes gene_type:complete
MNMTENVNSNVTQEPSEKAEELFLDMLTPPEEKEALKNNDEAVAEEEAPEEIEVEADDAETEITDEETEDQSEEDEVEEDSDEEPTVYSINVNGVNTEVTLEELKSGYSRQKDYTRKTQELAEQKRVAEQRQNEFLQKDNEVSEERALYKEMLPKMQMMIKNNLQREPDWQQLIDNDPQEYLRKKEEWNKTSSTLSYVETEMKRLEAEKAQAENFALEQQMQQGQSIINEKIPEWSDNDVAKAEVAEMMTYAQSIGFNNNELSKIYDGRLILLLRDAWSHSKTKKAVKTKPKESPARVSRPGNSNKIKGNSPLKNARKKLKETGSISDAAKVFEQLI